MNNIREIAPQITTIVPNFLIISLSILFVIFLFLMIYYLINIGNRHIEKGKRIGIDLKLTIKIFFAIVVIYILKLILSKYSIVLDTIWSIFAAIIVSFLINPLVNYLETKNINRKFGVIIVYLSVILIFGILLLTVIPKTIQETTNLLKSLPDMFVQIGNSLEEFFESITRAFKYDLPKDAQGKTIIEQLEYKLSKYFTMIPDGFVMRLKNLTGEVYVIFSKLLRFVLVFIFSFYFTVDKDKFKDMVKSNLPKKYRSDIIYIAKRIDKSLNDFVKGRLLMALFVGFATMIYLLVLGVDFAIVIGLITCIADIIPYIGPFLGFIPAVLFAFIDAPVKALWVAILFLLLQWAENNILAPKLLGDKTGLSPITILISIIVGGGVFGVLGMIFSVPVVSIVLILVDFFKIFHTTPLYFKKPPLQREDTSPLKL